MANKSPIQALLETLNPVFGEQARNITGAAARLSLIDQATDALGMGGWSYEPGWDVAFDEVDKMWDDRACEHITAGHLALALAADLEALCLEVEREQERFENGEEV